MSNLTDSDFLIVNEHDVMCRNCGEKVTKGGKYILYNNNMLCEHCAKEMLRKCEKCGRITYMGNMYKTEDTNIEICDNCAYELPRCYNCNAIYEHKENMYVSGEGRYYCEKHKRFSFINNYSYKPTPHFQFGKNEERNPNALVVGFELEVENRNDYDELDNWEIAEKLDKKINDKYFNGNKFIYYKHDGSVEHGFEIISHPFTEQFFRENINIFKDMLKILRDNNCVSHDSTYCGLHFHINRTFLTKEETEKENVDKLILFTEYYKDKIQAFSRRDNYSYCRFLSDAVSSLRSDKKAKNIKMIEKYKDMAGRYVVVNTQNTHTIEMRVFRGTLKDETFFATLEFVYNVANTIRDFPINKISWNKIVNNPKSKYVKDYCISRNIEFDRKFMRDLSLDYVKEINKQKRALRKIQKEILIELYEMYRAFVDSYKTLNKTEFNKILSMKEGNEQNIAKDINYNNKRYIPEILSYITQSFGVKNNFNEFYSIIAKILCLNSRHKRVFNSIGEKNHIETIEQKLYNFRDKYLDLESEI